MQCDAIMDRIFRPVPLLPNLTALNLSSLKINDKMPELPQLAHLHSLKHLTVLVEDGHDMKSVRSPEKSTFDRSTTAHLASYRYIK
jgi:hypothetical protein